MQGLKKMFPGLRRRLRPIENQAWWQELNYAQKFSVNALIKLGYELNFVRSSEGKCIVVMSQEDHQVTVDEEGKVDSAPEIKIRR